MPNNSNKRKNKKLPFLMQPLRRYSIKNNVRSSKDKSFNEVVMKGSKKTGSFNAQVLIH